MLAARVEDPPSVQDLVDRGELVKTWSMRGTLHLLPADEYGMWQAAFSTFDNFLKPAWSRASGLWPDDVERLIEAVGEALDDALLTREELAAAVEERTDAHTGEKARESWGAVLKPAAWAGKLVYGPSDGRSVRFTARRRSTPLTPGRRSRGHAALPGAERPGHSRGLRPLVGRAVAGTGGQDVRALGEEAVEVEVEGEKRWLLSADVDEVAAAAPPGAARWCPPSTSTWWACRATSRRCCPPSTSRACTEGRLADAGGGGGRADHGRVGTGRRGPGDRGVRMSFHRLCVFAGSSHGADPAFAEAARALGAELIARDIGMVYGGTQVGLMGVAADAVLEEGGEVIGVLPTGLGRREIAHPGLSDLQMVSTMHERKARMADLADGFVVLPGGLGTMEELMEAVTWNQLGIHTKPVGLLDAAGYWAPLQALVDHAAEQGFVRYGDAEVLLRESEPAALLDAMALWRPPEQRRWIQG